MFLEMVSDESWHRHSHWPPNENADAPFLVVFVQNTLALLQRLLDTPLCQTVEHLNTSDRRTNHLLGWWCRCLNLSCKFEFHCGCELEAGVFVKPCWCWLAPCWQIVRTEFPDRYVNCSVEPTSTRPWLMCLLNPLSVICPESCRWRRPYV